jgi:transcriptional regulator with XRE-family HTH domain
MPLKQKKKQPRLNFADAQAIRAERAQNPSLTLDDLAGKYAVSSMTISRVLRGEVHRKEKARKLTHQEVQELRYLARTDTLTQADLSKRFGISQGEVSRIVNGELYARVPPSTKEQDQIARRKAITEMIEREYKKVMASIPVVGDDGLARTQGNPSFKPPGSPDSGGQQP